MTQGIDTYVETGDDRAKPFALDLAVLKSTTTYLAKPPLGAPDFSSITSDVFSVLLPNGSPVGMSLRLRLIADDWQDSKVTAATAPTLTGTAVLTGALAALPAGSQVDFDVTALKSLVVSGATPWRGYSIERLDGGAAVSIGAFKHATYSPVETVLWARTPPQPVGPIPSGGVAVGKSKITIRVPGYGSGIGDADITQMQVQWYSTLANANAQTSALADDTLNVTTAEFDMNLTTSGFALPGLFQHRWYRTRVKTSTWSPWSDPCEVYWRAVGALTFPATNAPVDPDPDPLRTWTYVGTQAEYQVQRVLASNRDKVLNAATLQRVASSVTSTHVGAEVPGYFSVIDKVRVWDGFARADLPEAPAYAQAEFVWSLGDDPSAPAPENVTVSQLYGLAPYVVVQWTYRSKVKFRVRRTADLGSTGENVSGLLDPDVVLIGTTAEGDFLYQWIDYTAPGYTNLEYRVQSTTNNRGSTRSDPALIVVHPAGTWLADPDDGMHVFFADQVAPNITREEVGDTYFSSDGTETRRIVQALLPAAGTVEGRLLDIFDRSVSNWHQRLMRLRSRTAKTFMLSFPREVFPVVIDHATSEADQRPTGMRLGKFNWTATGDSILSGDDYDAPGSGQLVTWGYEEGTDGVNIAAGVFGVSAVSGTPKYGASSKVHGNLGAVGPGTVSYPFTNRVLVNMSIYYRSVVIPGSGNDNILKIQDPLTGDIFSVRVDGPSGQLKLFDETGGASSGKTKTAYKPGDKLRIDMVGSWDGATATVTFHFFMGGNFETISYADSLTASRATPNGFGVVVFGSNATAHKWDTPRIGNDGTWIGPYAPDVSTPIANLILTGGYAPTGAIVSTLLQTVDAGLPGAPGQQVNLAVSASSDMSSLTLVGNQTVADDSTVKHTISGLTANARYYVQPATKDGVLYGEIAQLTTAPSGGDCVIKMMLGSCQDNGDESPGIALVMQDIVDWAPHLFLHGGDFGYWGGNIARDDPYTKDLDKYRNSTQAKPSYRAAVQCATFLPLMSDHELYDNGDYNNDSNPNGGHYGDPGAGIFGSDFSKRELKAFQALMPVRTWGDTRSPRLHRAYYVDIGTKVRLIATDFRSPERNNIGDTDGPTKQMWGANQEAFIFASLDSSRVNLLYNETGWLANAATGSTNKDDKPWSYRNAQNRLVDKIKGQGAYAGGAVYKVGWLGGDRHYNGFLAATGTPHNTLGDFPIWIGSGFYKNSLPLNAGEVMTWQVGAGRDPNPADDTKYAVCGYMRMTLTVSGTTVTLSGSARAVSDSAALTPESTWTLSDYGPGTHVWTGV